MVALPKVVDVSRSSPLRLRRVAVVLNANARKVDGETVNWMEAIVPRQDLFLSRSLADGTQIAEQVVEEGYDAVLWGGGDGTFANGLAALVAAAARRGVELPDVGVLRLGTGNALAEAVGAAAPTARGLADDVRRARSASAARIVQMLKFEGRPTMFAGFGLDAQILADFGETVRMLERFGIAEKVRSAAARYFLSTSTRSIAHFIASERVHVVAINRGAPAIRVDVDGNAIGGPIAPGRVIWQGKASLASASTIPFYGLGLKMFPHAERQPGRFQLRISDAGAVEILSCLPKLWQGRYESPRIHDYLVDSVELMVARPAPFQSGGDVVGERTSVLLSLWDQPIAVV